MLLPCLRLTVPHHLRQERTSNALYGSLKSGPWRRLDHHTHLLLLLVFVSLHLQQQLSDLRLELIVYTSELSCILLHTNGKSLGVKMLLKDVCQVLLCQVFKANQQHLERVRILCVSRFVDPLDP